MNSDKRKLKCIQLIDDDHLTNFLNKKVIEQTGLKVDIQVSEGVNRALDFLTSTGEFEGQEFPCPGIIFLDINMPGLNGWDFMERYEKLSPDQKAKMVVAMLTTSENPSDRQKAEGFKDIHHFFTKPLTREKVMGLAESCFDLEAEHISTDL